MKNNLSFARQKGRPPFDYPLNYSNAAEPGKKRSREALPSLSFLPSTFHLRPRHRGFRGTPTTVRFRPTPSFIITSIQPCSNSSNELHIASHREHGSVHIRPPLRNDRSENWISPTNFIQISRCFSRVLDALLAGKKQGSETESLL